MKKWLAVFIIVLLLAIIFSVFWQLFKKNNNTTMEKQNELSLRVGEKKQLAGIYITLVRIIADDRCPVDIECGFDGPVMTEIKIESINQNNSKTVELNTYPATGINGYNFEGRSIKIGRVEPEKFYNKKIRQSAYKIILVIDPI